jgi:hypothetical protein
MVLPENLRGHTGNHQPVDMLENAISVLTRNALEEDVGEDIQLESVKVLPNNVTYLWNILHNTCIKCLWRCWMAP